VTTIALPEANKVFTPGSPISHRDFFQGRLDQINRILTAIPSPGRHPIIFGQRGVGKTSLVNILADLLPTVLAVKITCDGSDTFSTIWNRVLQKAPVSFKEQAFGFSREDAERHTNLASFLNRENGVTPSDVAGVMELVKSTRAVFVLDEFDRVIDEQTKRYMSDLIKNVSDNNPHVTIVIVGVGGNIADLIGEHPSIQRNLVQIEMPLMGDQEIKDVVKKGCDQLAIRVAPEVLDEIAALSVGFPHYAHLLGLSIAKTCESTESNKINHKRFNDLTCSFAIEDSIETYRQAFSSATKTANPSRYPQLLCACGYAKHDENGQFRTGDVVDEMEHIFGEKVTTHNIKSAMANFCASDRGQVLVRRKVQNVHFYKFREPMMRPFLRIKAKSIKAG
jgi:Cdc6-like AAA superfamily ATPase